MQINDADPNLNKERQFIYFYIFYLNVTDLDWINQKIRKAQQLSYVGIHDVNP